MYISFDYPWQLIWLLSVPILFIIHFFVSKMGRKKAMKFANFEAIERVTGTEFFSKNLTILYLGVLLLLILCFASAGLRVHYTATASEFSFVLAIDSSKSMEAADIPPSRFEAAKSEAKGFIDNAPAGTRMSIVSFAISPKLHNDLTEDKSVLKAAVDEISLDWIGGTNIFDAVVSGSNLLKEEDAKAVVLLSDGQINIETMKDAADYANRNDVVVHAIGIGTKEGGKLSYGTISKLDEEALQSLAYSTGGNYYSVENKQQLASSFGDIMKFTKRKISLSAARYLFVLAMLLFILIYFLATSSFKRIP